VCESDLCGTEGRWCNDTHATIEPLPSPAPPRPAPPRQCGLPLHVRIHLTQTTSVSLLWQLSGQQNTSSVSQSHCSKLQGGGEVVNRNDSSSVGSTCVSQPENTTPRDPPASPGARGPQALPLLEAQTHEAGHRGRQGWPWWRWWVAGSAKGVCLQSRTCPKGGQGVGQRGVGVGWCGVGVRGVCVGWGWGGGGRGHHRVSA
jgi:hypothetical protein